MALDSLFRIKQIILCTDGQKVQSVKWRVQLWHNLLSATYRVDLSERWIIFESLRPLNKMYDARAFTAPRIFLSLPWPFSVATIIQDSDRAPVAIPAQSVLIGVEFQC